MRLPVRRPGQTSLDRQPKDSIVRVLDQDQRTGRECFGLLGKDPIEPTVDGIGAFIRKPKDYDARARDDSERKYLARN